MKRFAIIGGTGSAALIAGRDTDRVKPAAGQWGQPSSAILRWRTGDCEIHYLARHGSDGQIAPHRVNYRANVAALASLAPDGVIGINAVGGITPAARPGGIVIPHQLIDYSWGREQTFCDGADAPLRHIEFDPPFDTELRNGLISAAAAAGLVVLSKATYACTQGPRLETAAEIDRLAADGCEVVGMTAMPEAALAREAGLAYAICAVVVNPAAGRLGIDQTIHGEIAQHLESGFAAAARLLERFFNAA